MKNENHHPPSHSPSRHLRIAIISAAWLRIIFTESSLFAATASVSTCTSFASPPAIGRKPSSFSSFRQFSVPRQPSRVRIGNAANDNDCNTNDIDERYNSNQGTTANDSLRRSIQDLVSKIDPQPAETSSSSRSAAASVVHIIGTGLTPTLLNLPLTTLHILSQADVVLYDALGLSREEIEKAVPRNCNLICVGKRGSSEKSWKQSEIDELLLRVASTQNQQQSTEQKVIVRLKGGDPFLFGRTRSEIDALNSLNTPKQSNQPNRSNQSNQVTSYTYTPGISSCIAAPHLAGIPLTDAKLNCQSFGVWSGTDKEGLGLGGSGKGKQWEEIDVDVLIFLMIGRLDKLEALCRSISGEAEEVETRRWHANTPCAVIQNAGGRTLSTQRDNKHANIPIQRVWKSTLSKIVTTIRNEDESRTSVSPAVFVVGDVCQLDLLSQ